MGGQWILRVIWVAVFTLVGCTPTVPSLQKMRVDVNFDADMEVESRYLIVGNRYCTFNIYGGTYGKKGNKPPIEEMQKDEAGYPVKDIEKLRKKWAKKGAERYEPNP